MTSQKLPSAIVRLVHALRAQDRPALLAAFADCAVVSDIDAEYRGREIPRWCDRLFLPGVTVLPINAERRNGAIVVTVVIGGAELNGAHGPTQLDWMLSVVNDEVAALTVALSDSPELPAPVAPFVLAVNTFNLQRLLAAFAEDAIVNDQLREYRGKPAIEAWANRDIVGNRMTMYVADLREGPCTAIVRAHVDGDFDKQGLPTPLVLSFYFTIHLGKIMQLIILRNEPDV